MTYPLTMVTMGNSAEGIQLVDLRSFLTHQWNKMRAG